MKKHGRMCLRSLREQWKRQRGKSAFCASRKDDLARVVGLASNVDRFDGGSMVGLMAEAWLVVVVGFAGSGGEGGRVGRELFDGVEVRRKGQGV